MPDTFIVEDTPQAVRAEPGAPRRLHNLNGGEALWHGSEEGIDKEGVVIPCGESLTIYGRIWVKAADFRKPVQILVEDL
jgi:hypothetical protein